MGWLEFVISKCQRFYVPYVTMLYMKPVPLNRIIQKFYAGIFKNSTLYCFQIYENYMQPTSLRNFSSHINFFFSSFITNVSRTYKPHNAIFLKERKEFFFMVLVNNAARHKNHSVVK